MDPYAYRPTSYGNTAYRDSAYRPTSYDTTAYRDSAYRPTSYNNTAYRDSAYKPTGYDTTAYKESDEYKLREYNTRPVYPLGHTRPLHGQVYPTKHGYVDRVTDYSSTTPYGYAERKEEQEVVYDGGTRRVW